MRPEQTRAFQTDSPVTERSALRANCDNADMLQCPLPVITKLKDRPPALRIYSAAATGMKPTAPFFSRICR